MNTFSIYSQLKNKFSPFLRSRIYFLLAYFTLYLIIFSFNFRLVGDPDFGWHLKYGEQIITKGNFLTSDVFSYTFKGQGQIQTEWLTEAIYYLIFSRWSFFGLSVFSAIVTSLVFFLPALLIPGSIPVKYLITLWALFGTDPVFRIGARPQNMSLLFFSIVFLILFTFNQKQEKKWLVLLPVIFFIWANSHPAFFVGLFILLVYLLVEIFAWFYSMVSLRLKQIRFCINDRFYTAVLLLIIFIFSVFLTTLRPQEQKMELLSVDQMKAMLLPVGIAANTSIGGRTRLTVSEFLPPILVDIPGTLFFLALIYIVALFVDRKPAMFDLKNLAILFGIIYFSTLTRRNTPFFFIVFLPIGITYTDFFIKRLIFKRKIAFISKYMPPLKYFILIATLLFVSGRIYRQAAEILAKGQSDSTYCQSMGYPCEAIDFIRKEKLQGNMFNHYNWGAYLVWKLPEYTVFIHGRFPPADIFSEYEKVLGLQEGWQDVLTKYNVKWFLLPGDEAFEEIVTAVGGWKTKYSDDKSIILVKP